MAIEFSCPNCKKRYKIKDELAGRKAKCAGCKSVMQIPEPAPAIPEEPALEPLLDELGELGNELPSGAGSSAVEDDDLQLQAPTASVAKCPSCAAPFSPGAVLCVVCGYNTKTGKKLTQTIETDKKAKRKKRGKSSFAFTLLRGTAFSLIGAIVGALVWAGIAVATQYEFGLIAWGVGGLAGIGMALGHDDDDGLLAGVIAAACAIAGVIAAKLFIVLFLIMPMINVISEAAEQVADRDPAELREIEKETLASFLTEEAMEQNGVRYDENRPETYERAWNAENEKALAEVEDLSEEDVKAQIEVFEAKFAAGEAAGGLMALFFSTMFSPIDGLFILLAVGTAFKLGSGEATD